MATGPMPCVHPPCTLRCRQCVSTKKSSAAKTCCVGPSRVMVWPSAPSAARPVLKRSASTTMRATPSGCITHLGPRNSSCVASTDLAPDRCLPRSTGLPPSPSKALQLTCLAFPRQLLLLDGPVGMGGIVQGGLKSEALHLADRSPLMPDFLRRFGL